MSPPVQNKLESLISHCQISYIPGSLALLPVGVDGVPVDDELLGVLRGVTAGRKDGGSEVSRAPGSGPVNDSNLRLS